MSCYTPLRCYEGPVKKNGKLSIVWKKSASWRGVELNLPCGQCIGCRLEKARQWAVRCMNEASQFDDNSFVTLTYDEKNLPDGGSLSLRDFQLFMKRLRKKYGSGIRYFHCGEYGDGLLRPHFHAILFNIDFKDKTLWSVRNGNRFYRSDDLESIWEKGFSVIGDVTFETAGYVARYCTKKVTGAMAEKHYGVLKPEYATMSRRPGLGTAWYKEWKDDVYPSDFMVVNGVRCKPPRYYDGKIEVENKPIFEKVKEARKLNGGRLVDLELPNGKVIKVSDNDSFRLPVKELVKMCQIKTLSRDYDGGL